MTPKNSADFTEDELRRIEARWKSDTDLKLDAIKRQMDSVNNRTMRLEIMVATAIGAILILGWVGNRAMDRLERVNDKLDAVAIRQAGAISSADATHKNHQDQIDRLRNGEKR